MPSFYIFLFCSITAIIFLAFLMPKSTSSYQQELGSPLERHNIDNLDKYSLLFFLLLCVLYIFYASTNSSFWHPDASIISYRITSGEWFPPYISTRGRFIPLFNQLFSFYAKFTKSPNIFHVLNVLHYFLSITLVWFIFKPLEWRYRVWPLIAILTTTSIFFVSQSFIYMEREVIFFLSVFILFYIRNQASPRTLYVFLVLCSAYLALFSKEHTLLIIGGFAISRVTYFYLKHRVLFNINSLRSSSMIIDVVLLMFIVAFLAAYYFYVTPVINIDNLYGSGNVSTDSIISTFKQTLENNWTFLLFLIFYPVRCTQIFFGKTCFHPVWDSFFIGALLFYVGNFLLNLNGPYSYYFSSGDFIVLVSFFGLLQYTKKYARIIPLSAIAIISLNLPSTLNYGFAYKKISIHNENVLNYLREFVKSNNVSIFVDEQTQWPAKGLEFALRFRGVDVKRNQRTLLINQKDTNASIRSDSKLRKLIYVKYYTFWFEKEEYLQKIQFYLKDKDNYLRVYPKAEIINEDDYLQPYLFEKSS